MLLLRFTFPAQMGHPQKFPRARENTTARQTWPSPQRHPGWPLDSLSIDRRTGAYFTDDAAEEAVSEAERLEAQARRARLVRFLETSLGL